MILMVENPTAGTSRDERTGPTWLDGVTYFVGTADEVADRVARLEAYRGRAAGYRHEPAPAALTTTEVAVIPDEWTAIESAADAYALVPAYGRLRALGAVSAIPTGEVA